MDNLSKNQKIFILVFSIIVIILLGFTFWNFNSDDNSDDNFEDLMINTSNIQNTSQNDILNITTAESEKIVVYIIGSVQNPGIVELNIDSRVSDAVEASGGLLEDADVSKINLAYKLEDGQKITIPSINDKTDEDSSYENYISNDPGNMISQNPSSSTSESNTQKVNINTATQTQLETLPGIGPSTASKIISYRNENGKFKSIEDIKNVSGIGDSKFENIKTNICV